MSLIDMSAAKPTKFTEVTAGSKITVASTSNPPLFAPYQADVIEMKPEYGPNRIPALVLAIGQDTTVIQADGTLQVQVLRAGNVLASATLPEGAVRARSIPVEVHALKFVGGVESATACIVFAAGLLRLRWEQDTGDGQPERLISTGLIGEEALPVGAWVVRRDATDELPAKAWIETAESFVENFSYDSQSVEES